MLKLQYFGHLMRRADLSLMLGKTEEEKGVTEDETLSRVRLFVIPWTAAHQAPLSFTISWSLLKLMSIELVMPSSHLVL